LWIGITDRSVEIGVFFPIREALLLFVPADIPEQTVHERDDMAWADSFGLPDRFIHCSGLGNAIHEEDLVEGNAKNVENREVDLPQGEMGVLFDDPVEAKPPPEHPLDKVVQKGPVSLGQIRA
jgi:hypothetical protein